jgi:hypothetical protein
LGVEGIWANMTIPVWVLLLFAALGHAAHPDWPFPSDALNIAVKAWLSALSNLICEATKRGTVQVKY